MRKTILLLTLLAAAFGTASAGGNKTSENNCNFTIVTQNECAKAEGVPNDVIIFDGKKIELNRDSLEQEGNYMVKDTIKDRNMEHVGYASVISGKKELATSLSMRGVVYDVGLMFGGTSLSVEVFDTAQVAYDMHVLKHLLRCNTIRIEGESIDRLKKTAELAHAEGLKIFFNPWKHEANADETVAYVREAAKVAEQLRKKGADITFITACEYTLFSRGAFPGDTFDERIGWLMSLGQNQSEQGRANAFKQLQEKNIALNKILKQLCKTIRSEFNGQVTYSSGVWETVDWSIFDIIGVDYYRNGESAEDYVTGLDRYKKENKPIIAMEMGCCAYEGAAQKGGFGFSVLKGVDTEGNAIWEGGTKPVRNEKEQADYIEENIGLLEKAQADGVFVYVFRYPIYPYSETGLDRDMVSYSLVKSFSTEDARSKIMPSWQPKEAFYRLGTIFSKLEDKSK